MDDFEREFAPSPVSYVGPFDYQDVVVNARRVPHLEAISLPGGGIHLTVDRRWAIDLSVEEAERIIPFVAHCLAVGMGYVGFPDEDMDGPVPAQPMPRVHQIVQGL